MMPWTGVASAAIAREIDKGKLTRDTVMPGFKLDTSSDIAGLPLMVGILESKNVTTPESAEEIYTERETHREQREGKSGMKERTVPQMRSHGELCHGSPGDSIDALRMVQRPCDPLRRCRQSGKRSCMWTSKLTVSPHGK